MKYGLNFRKGNALLNVYPAPANYTYVFAAVYSAS